MLVYLLGLGFLVVADILILQNPQIKARRGVFTVLASSLLIVLSSLRHETVGGRDVYITYPLGFQRTADLGWTTVLERLFSIEEVTGSGVEPGYTVFTKIVSSLGGDYRALLVAVALAFVVPLGWVIYRWSRDPFLSFVVYYVVFFSFFSLTGFRQTIATSIAVLIGYSFVQSRKLLPFLGVVALAFLFHRSALLYLLIFPATSARFIQRPRLVAATVFSVLIIFLLNPGSVLSPIYEWLGYEAYLENDMGGTGTFVSFAALVFLASLWRWARTLKAVPSSFVNLGAAALGTMFAVVTLSNQSFMRGQQYFTLLFILLIPDLVESFSEKDRIWVRIAIFGVLTMLLVRSAPEYYFLWHQP